MSTKRSRAAFESDGPPQHAPYAIYGTPLPAYDSDARNDGSYVPIWKQEVTDERGRKRLHGAFTGGWSAGYFNTVGSKEGWAPSTFASSRSDRAKDRKKAGGSTQRVEDFMDEEDLAERAESQKLETQGAFAGLGPSTGEGNDGNGGMFADIFRTAGEETMGVKLLQRMGWRPGQGVGPKVRRKAKGDQKGEMHLFAPENSRMISFIRKTDRKGLGFAGEQRLDSAPDIGDKQNDGHDDDGEDARILQTSRSKLLTKPKKIKKTGFGLGVLNDTGSDDEDEYDMGPKISYNRVIGGDSKKKKKAGLGASNTSPAVQKPIFTASSKKLAQRTTPLAGFRKCHDGRLPLDGFILTATPLVVLQDNKYPPPTVPDGWVPARLATLQSTEPSSKPYQSTADAAKASTLDPKSRAALLGEQQLPGKSVFDFISPAARSRLASATGNANLPPALGEGAPAGFQASERERRRTLRDLVPELDNATARAALQRGWMPYSDDSDKRERYRAFLELRAGAAERSQLPERPDTMPVEEWAKELREFAQAAEVFKPISGLMASRFTSSSTSSTPRGTGDGNDSSASPSMAGQKQEDPAEKAARLGMYGPNLTRSRQVFYPPRLLCKRFNVRLPANVAVDPGDENGDDGSGAGGGVGSKVSDIVSQASMDRMMREASFAKIPTRGGFVSGGVEGGDDSGDPNTRTNMVAKVDIEQNEALEGQKAGEAVFKAIFGSDDEDDDEL